MTKLCSRPSTKAALLVLGLLAMSVFAPAIRAQDTVDQAAVNRADKFLKTADRGRSVLGMVHFGAQYKGHTYQNKLGVRNRPSDFALVYRFNWENGGVTDFVFFCDSKGYVYAVQHGYTNAVLSQPFALANVSINIVGNLVIEAFRNQMTPEELQRARQMIDNPNARGLLEMSLKLQQAFSR